MSERVSLEGPSGPLEVVVEDVAVSSPSYGLICHPHPLYGGTMDNKVVTTVARALREAGIPSLRFNFRGVGASAGEFDDGVGETDDAQTVAQWGASRWPGRSLIIAGFSFGGYVALRLAIKVRTARLITIAPAVQRFDAGWSEVPDCPWLIVQGDADEVVDPLAVIAWAGKLTPTPQVTVLPGVGHFFHGHLNELRDVVTGSVKSG